MSTADQDDREDLRRFVSVLSHDLRSPFQTVSLIVEMLSTHSDPQVQKLAGRLERVADQLTSTHERIVDFARSRFCDGLTATFETVDLGTVVQNAAESVSLPPERLRVHSVAGTKLDVDSTLIAQLVENLVRNADEHGADEGTIEVEVITNDKAVTIVVTNPGPTIPADEFEQLFRPFHRRPSRSRTQGLGLGLYIGLEICRAHGGELTGTSTDDKTTFRARLPR